MNDFEKLLKKRIKTIKESTVILIFYNAFVLVLLALQAFGIKDIFSAASIGDIGQMFEMSVMGTCIFAIVIGVICLMNIRRQDWYGLMAILFFCCAILDLFLIITLFTAGVDNRIVILVFVSVPFACVCGLTLRRLRKSLQK